jgi:hypothetical protein
MQFSTQNYFDHARLGDRLVGEGVGHGQLGVWLIAQRKCEIGFGIGGQAADLMWVVAAAAAGGSSQNPDYFFPFLVLFLFLALFLFLYPDHGVDPHCCRTTVPHAQAHCLQHDYAVGNWLQL